MRNKESNLGTTLSYLLIGGGLGAILALLFAPKTGGEFRAEIADAARKGIDKTEEIANQIREKAQTVYTDTTTKAGEIYDSAKQKLNLVGAEITEIPENVQNSAQKTMGQITATIEAGKKEYEREASSLGFKTKAKANL